MADRGFLCLDDDGDAPVVVTAFKAARVRGLASAEKEANRVAAGRVPVERRCAHLKNRRILAKLRTDPARATHLFRVLLVLTDIEVLPTIDLYRG
ncbi:hypothetical protein [Streptomyces lateritius]|uniref:hypothetical protein n=1 Tax=Streptomyces lateritius TaxID=67313 RepID=UPI00167A4D39|nr:hypothetical protein [Streptomyces lateritius]GGT85481.1 hypothetical protein GCM10010272_32810 [Streptomyces lateritius]